MGSDHIGGNGRQNSHRAVFRLFHGGKSLQMLVGPINILLISYFTANKKENINRRAFRKILLVLLGLSGIIYIFSVIFTPVFISIFYPDMYGSLSFGLNIIVNLFHILNLSSSAIIVLVLTERGAETQMTIQMIYGLVFITASAAGTYFYQMAGFAIAGIAGGSSEVYSDRGDLPAVSARRKIERDESKRSYLTNKCRAPRRMKYTQFVVALKNAAKNEKIK